MPFWNKIIIIVIFVVIQVSYPNKCIDDASAKIYDSFLKFRIVCVLRLDFGSFSLRYRVKCFKGGEGGVCILGYC